MKQWKKSAFVMLLGAMLFLSAGAMADLDALVERLPAQSAAESAEICEAVLAQGSDALDTLCGQLVANDGAKDVKIRFATSGLTKYLSLPNASAAHRAQWVAALTKSLQSDQEPQVKIFLLRQLQWVGDDACLAAVADCIAEKALYDAAIRVLTEIGTPAATGMLLQQLQKVEGPVLARTVQALGELRCAQAANTYRKLAIDAVPEIRDAALFAIAQTGIANADALFEQAIEADTRCARARAVSLYLQYAERLAEIGEKEAAKSICQKLMSFPTEQIDSNVQCAALGVLVKVTGKNAIPTLLDVMDSDDSELRGAALLLSDQFPDRGVTKEWVKKSESVSPAVRAEILCMLGRRDNSQAKDALLDALESDDQEIRIAAAQNITRYGEKRPLKPLLSMLLNAKDTNERKTAQDALLRVPDNKKVVRTLARALPKASSQAKKALLEILAARRAESAKAVVFEQTQDDALLVRIAALDACSVLASSEDLPRLVELLLAADKDKEVDAAHQAVVAVAKRIEREDKQSSDVRAALYNAAMPQRERLHRVLIDIDDQKAQQTVAKEAQNEDPAIAESACRALADWQSPTVVEELIALLQQAEAGDLRQTMLEGCLRLVRKYPIATENKLWAYKELMALAVSDAEKELILSDLGDMRKPDSAVLAATYLQDESIKEAAAKAVVHIVCPQDKDDKGRRCGKSIGALKQALPYLSDSQLRKEAEDHIAAVGDVEIPPAPQAMNEEGFVPLFNGLDLTGWDGDMRRHEVEFGTLICRKGAQKNLYTTKDYANFVLRFEFKLTPGANNGLGIRVPFMQHAASEGMEIQVLDNTADQYKTLEVYQYHGSIYGVAPAKRGFLKPVGEWNSEEILADGRHIKVTLNGEVINDVDLNEFIENGAPDGKPHPGLRRDDGRICFCKHDSLVCFRNIRIKELP